MARLQFQPEPLERLQARVPEALKRLWTETDIDADRSPAQEMTYVFDSLDGLRIILSRNATADRTFLLASCSVAENTEMARQCVQSAYRRKTPALLNAWFTELCWSRVVELTGRSDWKLLGWSEGKGVPYFTAEESHVSGGDADLPPAPVGADQGDGG